MQRQIRAQFGVGAVLAALAAAAAAADTYPSRPIRVVIGTPAGGGSELQARYVGQALTQAWGQPVVVEGTYTVLMTVQADNVRDSREAFFTVQ